MSHGAPKRKPRKLCGPPLSRLWRTRCQPRFDCRRSLISLVVPRTTLVLYSPGLAYPRPAILMGRYKGLRRCGPFTRFQLLLLDGAEQRQIIARQIDIFLVNYRIGQLADAILPLCEGGGYKQLLLSKANFQAKRRLVLP